MIYGSVCSGIEAATVAWHPLAWHAAFYSEIDTFPCAVLAHHYPLVPNFGDMTDFQEWPDAVIDVLVGGTPCQSFSVAGLRGGLADPRGNLMLTYLAIADRYRPRWLVWENVPGVLSSNGGRDFGTFLGGLGIIGYGFAYRILDAQYFGVPQRRRRVFVVGCLGDWRRAAAVLFERASLSGHPAPRRESREGIAGAVTQRIDRGGCNSEGGDGHLVAPAITGGYGKQAGQDFGADGALIHSLAGSLGTHHRANDTDFALGGGLIPERARALTSSNQRIDYETETLLVAHSLSADGFDASEDGTGRGTPLVPIESWRQTCGCGHSFVGPLTQPCPACGLIRDGVTHGDPVATLVGNGDAHSGFRDEHGLCVMPFDTTQVTSPHDRSQPDYGRECHTLAKGAHVPAIAFGWQNSSQQGASASASKTPTLDKSKVPGIGIGMQVRRLTPRECERLQGFPDDYTLIPAKHARMAADGPRYKALGNSMAAPVMAWIGQRIAQVDAIQAEAA